MVDLKPAPESDRVTTVRRGLETKKLLLLVLVSILVHALGLFLFARYKPVEPTVSEKDIDPIEFTVVPEESAETAVEDEAKNTPPPEPKPQPAPPPQPEAEIAPPVTPPEPAPEPTPPPQVVEPEPTEPSESSQIPALSGSDEAISEPEPAPPVTPPEPTPSDSVATNQPPESEPVPPPESESKPANPDGVSTSASDLLGGDYEKTLASAGDAFFSEEALTFNAVLDPAQRSALEGFDLEKYFAELVKKLNSNLDNNQSEILAAEVNMRILKNGQLSEVTISESSGSERFDAQALADIRKNSPFKPLPPEFPLDSLELNLVRYTKVQNGQN